MEWKPMETAPRDGTRILLYYDWMTNENPDLIKGEVSIGWWDADEYAKNPKPFWHCDLVALYKKNFFVNSPPVLWSPISYPDISKVKG